MSKPSRAQFAVVVHVALQRADHLYLLRRANTGFMDGYHALPGGHQEHGESVEAAARRVGAGVAGAARRDGEARDPLGALVHRLEVVRPGYESEEVEIEVSGKEPQRVEIRLQRK